MSGMSSVAVQRLRKDAARLAKDPVPFILAVPLPSNILEWHYVVQGPPDSPYAGGMFHGKLVFPKEYPFKPPSIYMLTPNGRFQTNTRLCLSISDFHPDTWNPAWSVGTILTGLLSFMLETTPTLGSIETSDYEKRQYARTSAAYNLKNRTFRELFPELCEEFQRQINERVQLTKKAAAVKLESVTGEANSSSSQQEMAGDAHAQIVDAKDQTGDDAHVNHGRHNNVHGTGLLNTSAVSNLLVFAGVVAFVFVAKYVLQTAD